ERRTRSVRGEPVTAGPRGPTAGRDVAGPPAPDPIFTTELACVYCGKRVSLECWSGEHHMARTRMDGAAVPAPPAGLCAHPLDSMVCVAPVGHEGPHVTSNERFPHGLQLPGAPAA